jgi:hypothetical protein
MSNQTSELGKDYARAIIERLRAKGFSEQEIVKAVILTLEGMGGNK